MYNIVDYSIVNLSKTKQDLPAIIQLLKQSDLDLDEHINVFMVAKVGQQIIACAGIDNDIIKCVAIHPDYRGNSINLVLLEYVIKYANEQGHFHLFLYTKPENKDIFKGCGFYPIIEIMDLVILMENTPIGIKQYCQNLQQYKTMGEKIGSIVMNANPFTKGHLYLIEYAAKQCDWLHVFVVNEDASLFSFDERFKLVNDGTTHITNVTIHPSSSYIISKATFPTYFLKDNRKIERAYMGIDLLIFRNYIAPSLHITHRFVGTEPFSEITNMYNISMTYWLKNHDVSQYSAIDLIELDRLTMDHDVISASRVRALLKKQQYEQVKKLVPSSTWSYLQNNLSKFSH